MALTVNDLISSKMAPTFGLIGTSFVIVVGSLVGGAGEGVADDTGGHKSVAGLVSCWYFVLAILCSWSAYCTMDAAKMQCTTSPTQLPHR